MTVFLHSSFRVGSTWLWSRLRAAQTTVAYNEPFNDQLAKITRAELTSRTTDSWTSKHPKGVPYFLEFLPLIKNEGGVENYDASMDLDSFIPSSGITGRLSEVERRYLSMLIDHAKRLGRVPVVSDTRSLGRMRAMKAEFQGFHAVIYRSLFQQWCSYTEQFFLGNEYFFRTVKQTIELNQHEPFFKVLKETYPLTDRIINSTNYFLCFVFLHLHLYAQVIDTADLIVDVNRLARSANHRSAVERRLSSEVGAPLDLSDVKGSMAFCFLPSEPCDSLLDTLNTVAGKISASAPTQAGRDFVSKALIDLTKDLKRYHYYAGPLSLAAGPNGLLGERDELRRQCGELYLERDELYQQRYELYQQRDELYRQRDELYRERDELYRHRDERDELSHELAAAREANTDLRVAHEKILGSLSWRMTKPLRAIWSSIVRTR